MALATYSAGTGFTTSRAAIAGSVSGTTITLSSRYDAVDLDTVPSSVSDGGTGTLVSATADGVLFFSLSTSGASYGCPRYKDSR